MRQIQGQDNRKKENQCQPQARQHLLISFGTPLNTSAQGNCVRKMDASEKASYKPFGAVNMLASAQALCPSLYQALPAQSVNLLAVAWAEFLFHF